jgi:uncharacterized protein (TIGR03437 family)
MKSDAPSLEYCSVEVDSYSPEIVYAGTGNYYSKSRSPQGVARSPDGGDTWTFLPRFTSWPVCALAVDPANSARVLAGSAEGIFLSTDSGNSWKRVFGAVVTSLVFDGPNVIYAGTAADPASSAGENLLARSTDGGLSWTKLTIPQPYNLPPAAATWVSVALFGGTISLAASRPGATVDFYQSVDGGNSWFAVSEVGNAEPPIKLIFNSANGRLYIVGKSLIGSADYGTTWSSFVTTSGGFHSAVVSAGSLLAGGDQGLEAVVAPRFVAQPPIADLLGVAFAPGASSNVWAAGNAGLFQLSLLPQTPETRISSVGAAGAIAVGSAASDLVAASGNQQVFRSTDNGLTFTADPVIPSTELHAPFPPLVVDPVSSSSIFVAGTSLYHSTNTGASWTLVSRIDPDPSRVVTALAMAPGSRTVLYAATACLLEASAVSCPELSFIWRSANSGNTWVQQTTVEGRVGRIVVDPRQSNTVYAAIRGVSGDLLRSTNGGALWASVRANLPAGSVNDAVIDPSSLPAQTNLPAQTLYVGTDSGVFASFDSGARWVDISHTTGGSLPNSSITGLALKTPDLILLASTEGRGAFWTSVSGLGAGIVAGSLSLEVSVMKETLLDTGLPLFNASSVIAQDWSLVALDSWISVGNAEGRLRQRSSTEIPIAVSAVGLPIGTHVGRLKLTTGTLEQTIYVVVHVTPEVAGMTAVTGTVRGRAGSTVPIEVLVVDAEGMPLSDVSVLFSIEAGGGLITPRLPSTDNNGIARTALTLPATPGLVTIVATTGKLSVKLSAAAVPAPSIRTDSVVDGITFNLYTPLAPGSIISISGDNLSDASLAASGSPLPTLLRSTQVYLATPAGDVALPLLFVTPGQIEALVPVSFPVGSYNLRVEVASSPSNVIPIVIAPVSPGIFTINGSGRGPGVFFKDDGSAVTAANPAQPGSRVTFYADGLGAVSPAVAPGQAGNIAEPLNRTVATPRVVFDFYTADLIYSGLAPGAAGRYQVTVRVPPALTPSNSVSVSLVIGGVASNRVTIPFDEGEARPRARPRALRRPQDASPCEVA